MAERERSVTREDILTQREEYKRRVGYERLDAVSKIYHTVLMIGLYPLPGAEGRIERREGSLELSEAIEWLKVQPGERFSFSGGGKALEGATIGGALALAVAGGAVYLNKKGEKWKGMGKNYLKGVPGQFKGLTKGGFISTAN